MTEKRYDDKQRRTGTLMRIHDNGYGFLEMGRGEGPVFVLRKQVQPSNWVKGQRFSFILRDPKPGSKAPRADKLLPEGDPPRRAEQPELEAGTA